MGTAMLKSHDQPWHTLVTTTITSNMNNSNTFSTHIWQRIQTNPIDSFLKSGAFDVNLRISQK